CRCFARASIQTTRATRPSPRCCPRRASSGSRRRRTTARMPAADTARRDAIEQRPAWLHPAPGRAAGARWGWALAVALVLLVALGLRLWGVSQGLPYAYNADENAHFVNGAMSLFGHGWDPHYFVNPPAYTYLLHLVFAIWFGGRKGVADT